jgi:hypothetical protein
MASALDVPTLMLTPSAFAFVLISCIFIFFPPNALRRPSVVR